MPCLTGRDDAAMKRIRWTPLLTLPVAVAALLGPGGVDAGVIVMRAARAARLGARAGRLSRVAKIVRFLSGSEDEGAGNVRMAKVISNKLSDVLSIRVAFVVICVAVVLPSLSIFEYPEMEESLTAWTSFLLEDMKKYATGNAAVALMVVLWLVGSAAEVAQAVGGGR
eukprot:Skav221320  [mRNA]  locus=scaffold2901:201941:206409:- [translate_table: standard]